MKNLLVSFSGGETSAYMAQYLKRHKSDEYNMVFVFANTGQENEETLEFVDWCDREYDLGVVWVEALVSEERGVGTRHKIVNYETASRNGEPFEDVIRKYGIPNQAFPHCNREMKLAPIHSYIKNSLRWGEYYTAIGIRYDEIDRMSVDRKKRKIIYPLISDLKMTKPKINFWWSQQGRRLNLKGYQGNCVTCWKKSRNVLAKIAQENPEAFNFFKKMEDKYQYHHPSKSGEVYDESGNLKPLRFFRGSWSVDDVMAYSKDFYKTIKDNSENTNFQLDLFDEEESCDIYGHCGM
jgi:hypothetical protein